MATAKTGSFYLTETVSLAAALVGGSRVQGAIDVGAYVNVGTGQAIAIDQVDFIFQNGTGFSSNPADFVVANGTLGVQLTDLNPGTAFVRAENQALIASGALAIDQTQNVVSQAADLYPDNHGSASLSESFMVVNDTLYLVGGINGTDIGADETFVTARIRCRIVKLSSKDWMAIAIQSTASDN